MASKRRKKNKRRQTAPQRPRLEGMDRMLGYASNTESSGGSNIRSAPQTQNTALTVRTSGSAAVRPAAGNARKSKKAKKAKNPKQLTRSERLQLILRKKRRELIHFRIEAAALYVLFGSLAVASFFPIGAVQVRGLTHYPEKEVVETFGVKPGDNMFFCHSVRGSMRLTRKYPYFEKVRITRTLPDKLLINVTETQTVAAIGAADGGYYLVDENLRVLEKSNLAGNTPLVAGLTVESAEVGKRLGNDADGRVKTLTLLLNTMKDLNLLDQITAYNIIVPDDIYICYQNRVAVHIGDIDKLEQKLHDMGVLLEENLSPSDIKKLDVTGLPTIRLIPSDRDEVDRLMAGESKRVVYLPGETPVDPEDEPAADPNAKDDAQPQDAPSEG